jgi:hypothetical protein
VSNPSHFLSPTADKVTKGFYTQVVLIRNRYPEPSILAASVAYTSLLVRKTILRYLMLPRLFPVVFFEEDEKSGRINHMDYLVDPWYVRPTFWNRWGPLALITRSLGGKVPGHGGNKYNPQGYMFEDLGPVPRMGKGKDVTTEWEERLKKERHSGCPFAH